MADQATGLLSPWLRRRRVQAVRRYLAGRVLDFGCGTGALAAICAPCDYVGYDIDPESIALARKFHPYHRFETIFPNDKQFDTIALLAVIEHVAEPAKLLSQLRELLTPEGKVVMTTPHPSSRVLYKIGARAGLFSLVAHEEHERYLGVAELQACACSAGMTVAFQRRFLAGMNQMVVAYQMK